MHDVLQLDITGLPQAWISVEQAAVHVATHSVAWSLGDEPLAVLRGGMNTSTGQQSVLEVPAILALRGSSRLNLFDITPCYSKGKVLRRDRQTCAYCGSQHELRDLTVDHIQPASRGGPLSWMNTVAACRPCNALKADRTAANAATASLFAQVKADVLGAVRGSDCTVTVKDGLDANQFEVVQVAFETAPE